MFESGSFLGSPTDRVFLSRRHYIFYELPRAGRNPAASRGRVCFVFSTCYILSIVAFLDV